MGPSTCTTWHHITCVFEDISPLCVWIYKTIKTHLRCQCGILAVDQPAETWTCCVQTFPVVSSSKSCGRFSCKRVGFVLTAHSNNTSPSSISCSFTRILPGICICFFEGALLIWAFFLKSWYAAAKLTSLAWSAFSFEPSCLREWPHILLQQCIHL